MRSLVGLAALLAPATALALSPPPLVLPPAINQTLDFNGGEVTSGAYTLFTKEVTIGQPAAGGLVYARTFLGDGWRDTTTGTIDVTGSVYTVSLGASSEAFTLASGVYTSNQRRGSTLTFNSGAQTYTYTKSDGTVAVLSKALAGVTPIRANEGRVTSITYPTGEVVTFTYKTGTAGSLIARVQSVNNNLGYQLKFTYALNTLSGTGDITAWTTVTKVTGVNNATNYCDPTADSCAGLPSTLPSVTYATPGDDPMAETVTDQSGRVTRYTYNASNGLVGIRRPSSAIDNIKIVYFSGRVFSITKGNAVWKYTYTDSAGVRTTTITDPLLHSRVITSDIATGLMLTDKDALNRTTSYTYDAYGRRTRITEPEGNYVEFTYDARGNVTLITRVAKSGSGLANITASAAYSASCANAKTCNQPTSSTDERGKVTDYTYDSTHGGLLTVTAPAPAVGQNRPQTRYSYSQLYAWYKNSTGTVVQAPSAVWRLTGLSSCAVGVAPACLGTSNEVETAIGYGTTGVANNLRPASVTTSAGDNSLVAATAVTYSNVGDALTIDGPLAGATDTTRYRYDNARQLIGVVGPDPDGAGTLKNRAMKVTYDPDGRPILIERGTVNSQSDADWAAFAMLEQKAATYDVLGRELTNSLVAGGVTQALTQFSYDAAGRLDCTAQRMNPAVFASLPASACVQGTLGANGPDRISKNTYSDADDLLELTTSYATDDARDEVTVTYTSNGQAQTLTDGKGNKTTYEYDGFDRLKKIRYPSPSTPGTSSTTDYEEYVYDAASNVTSDRRRDGATVTFGYDDLGRQTSGLLGATYAYDNLSRMTSATLSSVTTSMGWDALGRKISETGPLGTVAYQYDLAGRRTRLTYPDSFYVTYDYNVGGDLTAIRENGAASGVGVLATYAFDNLGRRTSLTRGNGAVTEYGYDAASRLSSLELDLASTTSDVTFGLSYNAASQALSRSSTKAAYNPPAPGLATTAYTVNGLNQTTVAGGATLTYDGRGNLTGDGAKTYGYDVANRLTSVTGATLAYDVMGRLAQIAGASTTKFAYDGVDLIGEYSSGGTLLRRYVHGSAADEPLVWYEGSGTSDRRWLVSDQLGSVVAVTDATGASIATNTYDEYGQPGTSNTGRFQYTGQTWLPEVELYHYKARAYSPALGRFMQTDPIGYDAGMNMYAYVGSDPLNRVDPTGLQEVDVLVVKGKRLAGGGNVGGMVSTGSGEFAHVTNKYAIPGFDFSNVANEVDGIVVYLKRRTGGSGSTVGWLSMLQSMACQTPAPAFGGSLDAYAGLGASVGTAASMNPKNGQISISMDLGVGVGLGGGARATTGKFVGMGSSSSGEPLPLVGAGVNANATAAFGGGVTGSYQLLGSNQGDWGFGATGGAEASANANVSAHVQFNLPAMYSMNC